MYMYRKPICLISFVLLLSTAVSVAQASVAYSPPPDGWMYIYTGDAAAGGDPDGTQGYNALDGTWSHENGSDEWDRTAIGAGSPGGVSVLTDGGTNYIRLQETGDPRDHGMGDPSNRKLQFGHSVTNDFPDASAIPGTILDDGVTISFRMRIATGTPLDDAYPNDGTSGPWPAGGDGYVIHDGGKGCGIRQSTDDKNITFHLVLAGDEEGEPKIAGRTGLVMNNLNGTSPSDDVDQQGNDGGTLNLLDIADPTQWHEFWITIEADTTATGTHLVKVYMDGSVVANEFYVTAGIGNDYDDSYIAMDLGSTNQSGAIDVDFFAYKEGIELPVASEGGKASAPNPADGAEDVSIETNLTWTRGDGAKWDKVYFGTDPCDANLSLVATIPDFQAAEYDPGDPNLRPSTTYYWYVTEVNAPNEYPGPVWSFSTIPGEAQCQLPVDGAVIPGDPYPPTPSILYTELIFDPGPTAVQHTGYLSKVRDKVANRAEDANLGSPPLGHYSGYEYKYFAGHPAFYPFEGLIRGQIYYWTVDETDSFGNVYSGDVWEFAVQDYYAFVPSPPNEAIFIPTDVLLSWFEGYGAQNHDVFIGTSWENVNNASFDFSTPSDEYMTTTSTGMNYYQINGLDPETTYYWRIDEVQGRFPPALGTIYKGPVWEFTTGSATPGLTGEYYHHSGATSPAGFESKVLVRIDPNINFDWDTGSPDPSVNADNFSIRWTGQIAVPTGGETYTFTTETDDGVRLWVNGQLIIDQWIDQAPTPHSGDIELNDLGPYDIRMEYYENGGGAVARLNWQSSSTDYGIIPENFLSPDLDALTAYGPYPPDGFPLLELQPVLSWGPALFADTHNLYFSTDFDDVNERSVTPISLTDPCYHSPILGADQTYYWAVDGVNTLHGSSPWEGDVWSFRTIYIPPTDEPNLIGWWTFDEDVGIVPIALDWSGLENHGTLNGGPERIPAGIFDDALDFDGSSQYVEVPHSTSLGLTKNFTIAAWIRPDVVTGGRGIVTKCEGSSHKQYVLTMAGGQLRFEYELSGNNYSLTGGTVRAGAWQNVAVTVDGSLLVNLYINATSVASEMADGEVLSQTNPVVIGRWSGTYNSNYFDGLIDDVRIYNRVLSAAEIISTMSPPEAWMPYPADSATNVEDRSPVLSWLPGRYVQATNGHQLYFSPSFADVNERRPAAYKGALTEPNYPYPPPPLLLDRTYYWAVDEVNSFGPAPFQWKGRVWSFTTAPCISLDNMEDYNDRGQIRGVWTDGYASVGWGGTYPFKYPLNTASSGSNLNVSSEVESPVAGAGPIYGGTQAMVLLYENDGNTYT
ncbi:MAG: LamG-like jellyroll fold domain-containing protein, partial [Planctomycetota bacterium]